MQTRQPNPFQFVEKLKEHWLGKARQLLGITLQTFLTDKIDPLA